MNANRLSTEYWNGVEEFIKFVVEHANNPNRIKCSRIRCGYLNKVPVEVLEIIYSFIELIKVIQN